MSNLTSSGRGGAGNIVDSSLSPRLEVKDLETPVLTTPVVTTGRGGTGNMAKNTDPEETRARQDVEPVPRRDSTGATHVGRGGEGNVFKPTSEEAEAAKKAADQSAIADDGAATAKPTTTAPAGKAEKESIISKGKQWLLGKK